MSNTLTNILGIHASQFPMALCREFDSELFFADSSNQMATEQAKMICDFCQHKVQCRTEARERGYEFGIFGGEDEHERSEFIHTGPEKRYSAVHDLREMGLPVNSIARRLGMQHDSVTRNLRGNRNLVVAKK